MRISDWSSDVCSSDLVLMEADVEVDGDLQERNCTIIFRRRGKKVAVALIHRDLEGLHAELEFERSADRHGDRPGPGAPALLSAGETGSASCRASVCQYVYVTVGAGSFKNK